MNPNDINLQAQDAVQTMESDNAEIWLAYSFAPRWFADAVRELNTLLTDVDARQREILFSVAFGESYIVEWVRDEVLRGVKKSISGASAQFGC